MSKFEFPGVAYERDRLCAFFFSKEMLSAFKDNKEIHSDYGDWFGATTRDPIDHGVYPMTQNKFDGFFKEIESGNKIVFAIMYKAGTMTFHEGNVSIQNIDFINSSCEVSVFIRNGGRSKGAGKFGFEIALKHAFDKMGINRVWAGTTVLNDKMLKIFEGLNFQKEGVSRDAKYFRGGYHNVINYSILKKEYYHWNSHD